MALSSLSLQHTGVAVPGPLVPRLCAQPRRTIRHSLRDLEDALPEHDPFERRCGDELSALG